MFGFVAMQEIVLVMIVGDIVDYFPAEMLVEVRASVFDLCHDLFPALVHVLVLVLFHAHVLVPVLVLVLVNVNAILSGNVTANVAVDYDFCFLILIYMEETQIIGSITIASFFSSQMNNKKLTSMIVC